MSAPAQRARGQAGAAQRPAADPRASVWVGASAGTGKTKVLTDRALSLMLHGTPPARILCLTFTKAAAAEMANRLNQRLTLWATAAEAKLAEELAGLLGRPPEAEMIATARRLFARVLDAPGGMKIQTIHAFCQSLLGRFPLEAGVAPHFQVLDERSAAELLQEAREEVFAAAEDTTGGPLAAALRAALDEVSVYAQEQAFAGLVETLVRARARLRRLHDRHGGLEGVVAAVYRVLEVGPAEEPEALLREACSDAALDLFGLRLVGEALEAGSEVERTDKAPLLRAWLAAPVPVRMARMGDYTSLFLTQKDAPLKNPLTRAAQAVPGALAVMEAETERLCALRARLNALSVARATAALLRVGAAVLERYQQRKQARALLDYDDLILEAHDLLRRQGAASWVLYKLDGGLDHVLIDEAQDTNPEQWEVIDRLAAEFFAGKGARETARTVFAVGDAKQSIFSFQRADPTAFGRMRAHFAERAREAGQAWATVDLAHSFRSCEVVLRAVDAVFAQAAAQDGVLLDETALRHEAVRIGQAGCVELWPSADPAEAEAETAWEPPLERRAAEPARTRLARLVARRIWRWTTAPPSGGDEADDEAWLASKGRRLRPGDVLVLVRRRNEFVDELVRELKRLDVPVAGVDRMVLRDQLAVMDLVALGRVLLLPEDDLTLATVLKGPLLGLDEEQLFALAHGRAGSLWQALGERAEEAPFAAAHAHLRALQARADFLRPFELFSQILTRDWGPGRGRELLLARLGPDAYDPIEEFLSLALAYEHEHVPSLEGFLHWLEVGAQEIKRDMEHGRDSVRVMTVHGAKGLQAPVVILPDTLQGPPVVPGLLWLDGDEPCLWPLRKDYDGPATAAARGAARLAAAREYRRLLYVALSRAEDRLYVCGWNVRNKAPEDCWYRLVESALAACGEAVHFDFSTDIDGGWAGGGWRLTCPQVAPTESEREAPPPRWREPAALPSWLRRPPAPEAAPPRPLAPSRPAGEEPAAASPLGAEASARFRRGRLIHRLLQSLPELPAARRPVAARRFLASPLHGLSPAEQEEIAAATLAVLEEPGFAPLFAPEARAEVPILGARGGEVVLGQVDRLVVAADRVLIVDYKTDRPAPRSEAEVPSAYLRQMAAYRSVLAGVYPGRRIETALLWTDGPRWMQLSDAVLAGDAP